jgi:hypothetical protein
MLRFALSFLLMAASSLGQLSRLEDAERLYAMSAVSGAERLVLLHRLLDRGHGGERVMLSPACSLAEALRGSNSGSAGFRQELLRSCPGLRLEDHAAPAVRYDPVLLTLAAGVESRSYGRLQWQTLDLSPPSDPYFRNTMRIYFRPGAAANGRLFLLVGSSYSTWRGGSWISKVSALLDLLYPESHLLAVPGFLTPEFLSAGPSIPELSGQLTARDLYARLTRALGEMQQQGRIPRQLEAGIIGFSGGANIGLSLLAVDARAQRPLFGRGAMALSPILDAAGAFAVLDRSNAAILARGFPPSHALTTVGNMLIPALEGYRPGNVPKFLDLLSPERKRAEEFRDRFYREFQLVDLRGVQRAPYSTPPPSGTQARTFGDYYLHSVFPLHKEKGLAPSTASFAEYASVESSVKEVTQPVYVVVAQDDPVLVKSAVSDAAAPLVPETIAALRRKSNFRVFAPALGAHLGFCLDGEFLRRAVVAFFGQP